MRERHVLRAWPLTPIHVGTGEELTPESFALEGTAIRAFNSFAALSAASDRDRERYRSLLEDGDLVGAQKHLAGLAVKSGAAGSERIEVSEAALDDLRRVMACGSGRGAIRPFARCGGRPILPGSSLKGAFRTAWLDQAWAAKHWEGKLSPSSTKDDAQRLNDRALGIEAQGTLEQDPFRDVALCDAAIPAGRTRYDSATLGKLDEDKPRLSFAGLGGIQMHVERLVSLADGGQLGPIEVEIDLAAPDYARLREGKGKRRGAPGEAKRIVPKEVVAADALWAAANRFHAQLWGYERRRFYDDGPTGPVLDRLLAAFGVAGDDGGLASRLDANGLVLLRVGRYGQFESKAVRLNGERHGVKAATRGRPAAFMDMGGTRTVVRLANGAHAPFGWLLLALPGKGPEGVVRANLGGLPASAQVSAAQARGPSSRETPGASGGPALAGRFRFRKGDQVVNGDGDEATVVRDVGLNDAKMDVDFGDGAEEWAVGGWRLK